MPNPPLTEAVYYILLSLLTPMHGYGVMQRVEELSSGRVRLAAGTLYGAITTLLDRGWICALPENGRKKEYVVTRAGRAALLEEHRRLRELYENGAKLLEDQV